MHRPIPIRNGSPESPLRTLALLLPSPIDCESLSLWCQYRVGCDVVEWATSIEEGVELCRRIQPRLLVIDPAIGFSINRGLSRVADKETPLISLVQPTTTGSHVRFSAVGASIEFSIDGGSTWQAATRQTVGKPTATEHFASYWTPIPAGVTSIVFRGEPTLAGDWIVRDVSAWSLER